MAQGAKPGEGGELPGHKAVGIISETRRTCVRYVRACVFERGKRENFIFTKEYPS